MEMSNVVDNESGKSVDSRMCTNSETFLTPGFDETITAIEKSIVELQFYPFDVPVISFETETRVAIRQKIPTVHLALKDVSLIYSRVQDIVDDDSIAIQNTDFSPSGKSLAWEVGDSDAPNG
ncbi:hypothetical protein L1887_21945 [Cichorium endivia]|nr:hypothetical protein L1887_21945 [Cichorium endivia]